MEHPTSSASDETSSAGIEPLECDVMGSNRFITDDDDTIISLTFPSREESMELGDSAEVESGGLLSQYEDAEEEDMNTRQSMSGFATLMLPALVRSENDLTKKNSPVAQVAPPSNLLERAHAQIRRGAGGLIDIAERAQAAGKRQVEKLQEKPPLCFIIVNRAYHKYGLKHVVLILVFLLYTAFGAGVFLFVEGPYQEVRKANWAHNISIQRGRRINDLMSRMFNNSEYLVYIKGHTSNRLSQLLNDELASYERQLGIRWSEQKMDWDFWTALLFAGTICTTIGYGHIYPMTPTGRIFTMVFALFGIPLMLLVLQDFGKLLTLTMKFPWFQTKRLFRRIFRCCTKQSLREMREIEDCERRDLEIFDLPLIVGVALIIIWVFVCSFVLSVWDSNWTLLESFYFFFTSLSTVGLGDLVPSSPRVLITMFGFILVGLSLVSMVINLMQTKMKKTYEAGKELDIHETHGTSLGIIQCFDDMDEKKSLSSEIRSLSRSTQTSLSLPGVKQVVLRSDGVHWVTDASPLKSPDEVTRLVELESSLRVCEQIGDNNEDDDDNDDNENYLTETDVLLVREECCSR